MKHASKKEISEKNRKVRDYLYKVLGVCTNTALAECLGYGKSTLSENWRKPELPDSMWAKICKATGKSLPELEAEISDNKFVKTNIAEGRAAPSPAENDRLWAHVEGLMADIRRLTHEKEQLQGENTLLREKIARLEEQAKQATPPISATEERDTAQAG